MKAAGDLLSDDKKLTVFTNERSWVSWANNSVGLPSNNTPRFYTIIKDEKVSALVDRWVRHEFGRETFVISHWTSLQSQRIPQVGRPIPIPSTIVDGERPPLMPSQYWNARLTKFWDDFERLTQPLTPAQRQNISKADLDMLLATSQQDQIVGYTEALRILFFPKPHDVNDSKVNGIPIEKEWWRKETARLYKK